MPNAIEAWFDGPTDRYPHNILGDLSAHTDLVIRLGDCPDCAADVRLLAVRLPEALVFEDTAPRLVDLDGDGQTEIVVVESHQDLGARLPLWEIVLEAGDATLSRGATTEFSGTRFRWLAPVGAADFDGDGLQELAYVETPHRDRVLRIVRREGDRLIPVAALAGVTNHAIGQEGIQSRIETCPDGPAILALEESGRRMLAIRILDGRLIATDLGPARNRHHLDDGTFCALLPQARP